MSACETMKLGQTICFTYWEEEEKGCEERGNLVEGKEERECCRERMVERDLVRERRGITRVVVLVTWLVTMLFSQFIICIALLSHLLITK